MGTVLSESFCEDSERTVPTEFKHLVAEFADGTAMGDEEHGLLGECREEPGVKFTLGGFVERRGDLVEQQDIAIV